MKLAGQTALVTGASRGIGREIALAFAKEAAVVAVTGRSLETLEALQSEIVALEGRCFIAVADLSERGAVDRVLEAFSREVEHFDILVNNAGVGSSADPKPVTQFDDRFWEATLYLNLTVPYLLCKRLLPGMIGQGYGRIINIASINGKVGSLHGSAYAASKHGLLGLTRTLALEVAKTGVTVNAICPGPVRTRLNDRRIAYDAARLGKPVEVLEAELTPLGRRLEPWEVAPLAVYLASREASVVTGQAINIDGGLVMY